MVNTSKKDTDSKDELLKEAKARFAECEDFYSSDYQRAGDDVRFTLGDQWEASILQDRKNDGRVCLTENRLLPFINQTVNNVRQMRPSIIVRPVDSGADPEVAEIYRGVIRNIESVSNAEVAYDTAIRNSTMSGIGWLRVVTDYCDYDTFDQEVRIERIQDFQSVYLDPAHQNIDGSDAEFGFVFSYIPKEEFEEEYPDADTEGFKSAGWSDSNSVRVCEYIYKSYEEKTLYKYQIESVLGIVEKTGLELPEGALEVDSRSTRVCTIKTAKFTECDILEEGEFAGGYIPLVPTYGFESFEDGKRTFYSLIHQAKDAQRSLNYWKSASAEIVALQPKSPYIGAKGQFDSYGEYWASANTANLPFLEYDQVVDENGNVAPPPQRQQPPTSSGSLMQEAAMSAEAIKASLGVFDPIMGEGGSNESGKAIISRQLQGDLSTFHFADNLGNAIRHVGRIIVDLIPIVYSGERIIRILGEDGKESMIPLMQHVSKMGDDYVPAEGRGEKFFNLDAGKYDVVVEVGSSYATRRQESANMLIDLSRANPEFMNSTMDLLIKSLDIPNGEEIAKRVQATMNPALLGDDVEAKRLQDMHNALQELQEKLAQTEQALLLKRQDETVKNEIDMQKVKNDTAKTQADVAKTMAEIEQMRAETNAIPAEVVQDLASAITDLNARNNDIEGALDVILTMKEEEAAGVPQTPVTE